MAKIYGTSTVSFPDDAYGWDTDNPPTAFELLDNAISAPIEQAIQEGYRQWLEDTAREYFSDVGDWTEEWKDAWRDIVGQIV